MQKYIFVCKRLKVGIRASSTLAWYKNGRMEKNEVTYNFEHGVFQTARLKHRDYKLDRSSL